MSEEPIDILCMACADTRCDFKPVKLQRRALGDMDILFDVKYCGVCHSDLHSANGHLDSLVGKEVATFGLGCFWGVELAFMREPGVVFTEVGYTQGDVEAPTYEQVCTGTTGHTEAIQVMFDPEKVSFQRLCELAMERLGDSAFLLNQVGSDEGTQYRHGIYYHSEDQRVVAQKILVHFGESCAAELKPSTAFWDFFGTLIGRVW